MHFVLSFCLNSSILSVWPVNRWFLTIIIEINWYQSSSLRVVVCCMKADEMKRRPYLFTHKNNRFSICICLFHITLVLNFIAFLYFVFLVIFYTNSLQLCHADLQFLQDELEGCHPLYSAIPSKSNKNQSKPRFMFWWKIDFLSLRNLCFVVFGTAKFFSEEAEVYH